MSAHTPGPWRARRDPNHSCEWEAVIDIADGQLVVAATFGGAGPDGNEENAEANARLIAAAPELLASLSDAMDAVKTFHGPDAWEIYERHSPEMKRWSAAIAKATGAQS